MLKIHKTQMKNKALFLDRDGIINEDISYLYKPDQVIFCRGIFDLCQQAQILGYKIIVISNQSGIARGYFTEEDVRNLHIWMMGQFAKKGLTISGFYYCPYHPKATIDRYKKDSFDRKPNPGMVLRAAKEHTININESIFVGDKPSDRLRLTELKCIIIKSRYTEYGFDVTNLLEIIRFL